MPTANEELLDATVRHQIVVLRFSDRMAADAARLLEASDRELVAMLQTELTEFAEARLNAMLIEVRRLRAAAIQAVDADVRPNLDGLSQVEATWEVGAMGAAIPVELTLNTVAPATLRAVVASPINGIPLQGWWDRLAASDAQRIEQQLRLGILQGETTDQIVRRIRGTKAAGYSDGVLAITKRDAETVVRTAANHVSTGARQATWDANADIISGVRWVSTLDGRTSAVCRSRDGEVYPIDKGPRPPAHPNCRSTVVPVLAGEEIVGDRPTVRDARTRRKRELDFAEEARDEAGIKEWSRMSASERRAKVKAKRDAWADENIGSTPSNVTYQDWIKRQPAKFQDEVLGPTRARLFREGGVPLDKFVDASGKQYNLDQLRTRLDDDARELLDRLNGTPIPEAKPLRDVPIRAFAKSETSIQPGTDERVWLTADKDYAWSYAENAAEKSGGRAVVMASKNLPSGTEFGKAVSIAGPVRIEKKFYNKEDIPDGWFLHGTSEVTPELQKAYNAFNRMTPEQLAAEFRSTKDEQLKLWIRLYVPQADIGSQFSTEIKRLKQLEAK